MSTGVIKKVAGPLVIAEGMRDANMFDVVRVSNQRLIGEIIEIHGDEASIQVYEETSGLGPGEPVESMGVPMSVELGPGLISSIYDGIPVSYTHLVGDRLGHFHVGESNRRPPKEDGRIPWDEITGALKEIHYQGAVVMEPFIKMGGEVGRDIKVWRDISENASAEEMEQLVKNAVAMLREKLS